MHLKRFLVLGLLVVVGAQRVDAQQRTRPAANAECGFQRGAPVALNLAEARFGMSRWRLTLVRDSLSRRGLSGLVVLYHDLEHLDALLGRAWVNLDSAGGTYEYIQGSFDQVRHDVYARTEEAGTVITLGRRRTEHADGSGTYLHVTYAAGDTLAGFWMVRPPMNGPRVAGHFCLIRDEKRG